MILRSDPAESEAGGVSSQLTPRLRFVKFQKNLIFSLDTYFSGAYISSTHLREIDSDECRIAGIVRLRALLRLVRSPKVARLRMFARSPWEDPP